jgi:hypothetical protein
VALKAAMPNIPFRGNAPKFSLAHDPTATTARVPFTFLLELLIVSNLSIFFCLPRFATYRVVVLLRYFFRLNLIKISIF